MNGFAEGRLLSPLPLGGLGHVLFFGMRALLVSLLCPGVYLALVHISAGARDYEWVCRRPLLDFSWFRHLASANTWLWSKCPPKQGL